MNAVRDAIAAAGVCRSASRVSACAAFSSTALALFLCCPLQQLLRRDAEEEHLLSSSLTQADVETVHTRVGRRLSADDVAVSFSASHADAEGREQLPVRAHTLTHQHTVDQAASANSLQQRRRPLLHAITAILSPNMRTAKLAASDSRDFGGKYAILEPLEASALYRCLDKESLQEYVCKVRDSLCHPPTK